MLWQTNFMQIHVYMSKLFFCPQIRAVCRVLGPVPLAHTGDRTKKCFRTSYVNYFIIFSNLSPLTPDATEAPLSKARELEPLKWSCSVTRSTEKSCSCSAGAPGWICSCMNMRGTSQAQQSWNITEKDPKHNMVALSGWKIGTLRKRLRLL